MPYRFSAPSSSSTCSGSNQLSTTVIINHYSSLSPPYSISTRVSKIENIAMGVRSKHATTLWSSR